MKYMESDKKKKQGEIFIAVLEEIGKAVPKTESVSRTLIEKAIAPAYIIETCPKTHEQLKQISIPGSKSITNRVLLMCALGANTTKLTNILDSEDTRVMLQALQ